MPFQLLTFPITISTPGFISPANFGAPIFDPPLNSFLEAALLITTAFDQPGEIDLILAVADASPYSQIARYDALSSPGDASVYAAEPALVPTDAATVATSRNRIQQPLQPCTLYCAFYDTGTPPSTGAATVLIKIYS